MRGRDQRHQGRRRRGFHPGNSEGPPLPARASVSHGCSGGRVWGLPVLRVPPPPPAHPQCRGLALWPTTLGFPAPGEAHLFQESAGVTRAFPAQKPALTTGSSSSWRTGGHVCRARAPTPKVSRGRDSQGSKGRPTGPGPLEHGVGQPARTPVEGASWPGLAVPPGLPLLSLTSSNQRSVAGTHR